MKIFLSVLAVALLTITPSLNALPAAVDMNKVKAYMEASLRACFSILPPYDKKNPSNFEDCLFGCTSRKLIESNLLRDREQTPSQQCVMKQLSLNSGDPCKAGAAITRECKPTNEANKS